MEEALPYLGVGGVVIFWFSRHFFSYDLLGGNSSDIIYFLTSKTEKYLLDFFPHGSPCAIVLSAVLTVHELFKVIAQHPSQK